jgi:SAM-dependent methyltransferase
MAGSSVSDTTKTNAAEYSALEESVPFRVPLRWWIANKLRQLLMPFREADDFDWNTYNTHYRCQFKHTSRFYTLDLNHVEFKLIDNSIYLLGDCKPLHPTHRCLWEAICNLGPVDSVAEIGAGGGFLLAGVGRLLGKGVRLSAYDISEKQLRFLNELWPDSFKESMRGILDITSSPIPESQRPDVVFESTVLMHIQRREAYHAALRHFLLSGTKYGVLMDNWNSHDYFSDLTFVVENTAELAGRCQLYYYDSGSNIAVAVSTCGVELMAPYQSLTDGAVLKKYLTPARH